MPNSLLTPRRDRPNNNTPVECSSCGVPARPLLVTFAAINFAAAALFVRANSIRAVSFHDAVVLPLILFSIGFIPLLGASVVVWTLRSRLSPAERRAQIVGAALSSVLFLPALFFLRFFH